MLPVNTDVHCAYQNFVTFKLGKYYPAPKPFPNPLSTSLRDLGIFICPIRSSFDFGNTQGLGRMFYDLLNGLLNSNAHNLSSQGHFVNKEEGQNKGLEQSQQLGCCSGYNDCL